MMGRTHALSGVLVMLVAAPVLDRVEPSLAPQGLAELAAAAVCAAGAALLPDLDHPGSTAARSFGAATEALARWIAGRFGGHRGGTHSVPAILMAAEISGLVGGLPGWFIAVPTALIALLVGLAARAFGIGARNTADTAAASVIVVLVAVWVRVDVESWLGVSVGLGVAAHIAGDCLTVQGCPLWWPVRRRYRAAALVTNGRAERVISWAMAAGIAAIAWLTAAGPATGHPTYPAGLSTPTADAPVPHRHTDA